MKVLESHDSPRSYIVQDRNGQRFRRNRRHLQHIPEQESEQEQVSGSDIQEPVQESAPEADLVEWGFYALSASKAIFRARTYNCNLFSPVMIT